jgi:hypothetical protein
MSTTSTENKEPPESDGSSSDERCQCGHGPQHHVTGCEACHADMRSDARHDYVAQADEAAPCRCKHDAGSHNGPDGTCFRVFCDCKGYLPQGGAEEPEQHACCPHYDYEVQQDRCCQCDALDPHSSQVQTDEAGPCPCGHPASSHRSPAGCIGNRNLCGCEVPFTPRCGAGKRHGGHGPVRCQRADGHEGPHRWISGDDRCEWTMEPPEAACDHLCSCGHEQQDHTTSGYCNGCEDECENRSGHYPSECDEPQAPEGPEGDPYAGEAGNCANCTSTRPLAAPEGPEYTPCVACGHIEPEHEPDGNLCFVDGCDCNAYRTKPDFVLPPEAPPRPPYAVAYSVGGRLFEAWLPGDATAVAEDGALKIQHADPVIGIVRVAPVMREG